MAVLLFGEVGEKRDLTGKLVCRIGEKARFDRRDLRKTARMFSDRFLSSQGNEPSDYFGTFYRYRPEWNERITGWLNRKEALFGEFGPDEYHQPLVTFSVYDGIVEVEYKDLTQADFDYVSALIEKIGFFVIKQ